MKLFMIFTFLLSHCHAKEKRVLIFGGNGFIGGHVVAALSEENYKITLVYRGNSYFNSDKEIVPYADKIILCDRNTLLRSTCPGLLGKSHYDAVIDFSSYNEKQIEQVIDILKDRVGLYVYISSDAVYEVSEKYHTDPTREDDSNNEPKDEKKRVEFEKNNQYGAQKKGCEERLRLQRERFGFPYVILRLADVIGDKDTSYRWWNYQIWMKLHQQFNTTISLPNGIKDHTFSMVYVKDVALAIAKILKDPAIFNDQTINLAFKEDISLTKILKFMQNYYSLEEASFNNDDSTAFFRYPTAERGPIDVSNAEILLDWSPTNFESAAKNICEFFDDAMVDPAYAKDREIVLAEFIEETLPESFDDEDLFVKIITKAYSPAVLRGIDIGLDFDETEKGIEARKEL